MRVIPSGDSPDLEDRRGQTGGGGRFRMPGGRLGLGGLVIVLVLSLVFKQNFFALLGGGDASGPDAPAAGPVQASAEEEQLKTFIGSVLDDVQSTWDTVLPGQTGKPYEHAHLVLFRDAIESACGFAESATGPFYCPGDHKVYLDLGFYQELDERFGAPGDFAQAYVLAHELGHHLQLLLGTESTVRRLQSSRPAEANQLSVQFELQADCYAGVWGSSAAKRGELQTGDVEEGLSAAAAVGDDRIQRMSTGRVSPEDFTHGSAQQRTSWFQRGLSTGRLSACDTFAAQ
jgi:predicted metalloprotease